MEAGSGVKDEVILAAYSEIGLKSPPVRRHLEALLLSQIRKQLELNGLPTDTASREQGRLIIEGSDSMRGAEVVAKVFGVASAMPAVRVSADVPTIAQTVVAVAEAIMAPQQSFAINARRTGKHPYTSKAIEVAAGDAVHRVEVLRVQLQTLTRFSEDEEVNEAAQELQQKLEDLQMDMVDLRLTGQGQDGVRFEARLLQKLGYLTGNVSVADFPPTDQDLEVQRLLHDRLGEHLRAVDALVAGDVAAFNALLESKGMGGIGG